MVASAEFSFGFPIFVDCILNPFIISDHRAEILLFSPLLASCFCTSPLCFPRRPALPFQVAWLCVQPSPAGASLTTSFHCSCAAPRVSLSRRIIKYFFSFQSSFFLSAAMCVCTAPGLSLAWVPCLSSPANAALKCVCVCV